MRDLLEHLWCELVGEGGLEDSGLINSACIFSLFERKN